jgi:hypothetical protein
MGKGEPELDKPVAKPAIQDPSVVVKPIAKPAMQDPSVVVGVPLAHDDTNQQTITDGEVIIEVRQKIEQSGLRAMLLVSCTDCTWISTLQTHHSVTHRI